MYDYSVFFTDVINGRDNNLLKIAQFKMPAYVNYLYDSSGVTVLTNGLPNYIHNNVWRKSKYNSRSCME